MSPSDELHATIARLEGEKAEAQRWAIAANVHRQVQEFITADEARIRKHSDACLERVGGRIAALAAALLRFARHDPSCQAALADAPGIDNHPCNCGLDAVLSDTGEGWLPPDKVEQTKGQGAAAFRAWAEANKSKIHIDALDEAAMGYSAGWDAALDALKEK